SALNNVSSTVEVSPVATKRINTIHPQSLIIGDPSLAVQTRRKEEMQQFKFQNVWVLIDLPEGKYAIGTKWILKNKKDVRGIVVRNKARLVAQGHRHEEGIDYDEVFGQVSRIEAIRLFLAFASYIGFLVYHMDVKSAFLYERINKEVYVIKPKVFMDHQHPKKVYKGEFQMSAIEEITFFLGLQVQQSPDGIFINQDKYMQEILNKFDLGSVRTATTPYEAPNPKSKNESDSPVNVHLYRSMIEVVKKIFKYLKGQPKLGLWYPKESPLVLEAYSDSDYDGANKDRKITTGGYQFLGRRLISCASVPSGVARVPTSSFVPTGYIDFTFDSYTITKDSDNEASPVWSAVVVWEYYENYPVAGAGLILWGDLQVLFDSHAGVSGEVLYMFTNVSYHLSVKLMERMLTHKLEIDLDVVGNDMTTAEQLIQFIKNQLAAAQAPSFVQNYMVFNSPMLHLLRVEMVINSPWIMPILGTKELASPEQMAPELASPEKTAPVATSRYVVPTGRVIVPTGMINTELAMVGKHGINVMMVPRFSSESNVAEVEEQIKATIREAHEEAVQKEMDAFNSMVVGTGSVRQRCEKHLHTFLRKELDVAFMPKYLLSY
nr:putative ribonuclease H-like domain-containing protein [Tanacetum cinerariifolium]